jgi:transcriptional regulator with XRE-family HTH domain
MAAQKKEQGAASVRVASNLRAMRAQRGLSTYALGRKLAEIGWPIRASIITRIEGGERRVDVDDLVALAVALDVSPGTLLMPETQAPIVPLHVPVDLPGGPVSLAAAWAWVCGERPLFPRLMRDEASFALVNRPHRFALLARAESLVMEDGNRIGQAVLSALSHGTSPWQLRTIFEGHLVGAMNAVGGPAMTGPDYPPYGPPYDGGERAEGP